MGEGPGSGRAREGPPSVRASSTAHASRGRVLCFDALGAGEVVFGFCPRPLSAIGDERFTSQGSQQPPGSPLSREEGEAPPPTPAPEGRRRSRRVRLRGSCRHRPSLLGRRELATSAPVRPAPASSEVSEVGNNGARGSEGGLESRSSSLQRGPRARELRPGPEAPR